MATCNLCGDAIEFKEVNGICTPMHRSGRCKGAPPGNSYRDFKISPDSCCYSTKCPECREEVFFIRHNGGSVWIDHPLGPPWYKHSCFLEVNSKSPRDETLSNEFKLNREFLDENETLTVVSMIDVSYFKKSTRAIILNGNNTSTYILLSGNAGSILGKLCVYNKAKNILYPLDTPHHIFTIAVVIDDSNGINMSDKVVVCPECGETVKHREINRHISTHPYMSKLKPRTY